MNSNQLRKWVGTAERGPTDVSQAYEQHRDGIRSLARGVICAIRVGGRRLSPCHPVVCQERSAGSIVENKLLDRQGPMTTAGHPGPTTTSTICIQSCASHPRSHCALPSS